MADDSLKHESSVGEVTRAVADRVPERMTQFDQERVLLKAVVANIPAALVAVDLDGTAVVANGEALRLFGKADLAELSVETKSVRADGSRVPPYERAIARALAGEVVGGETYELRVDGREVILEASTAPLASDSGVRHGVLAIFRDVTAREQAERAERDFVTNAAHELQSPLAAIVSAIEVLQAGAKDGAQRDIFLGHIEREADRLARLVRALLILARTQIGLEAPRDEIVALRPLFMDVGSSLRLAPSVRLEVDCPEDLAVLTNRELVEQAVVNLAENAAKNTPSGKVVLSARQLPDDVVEIVVADTGPGIDPRDGSRIFERFYRGHPEGSPGFGLGLAIVKAVADALEGEVELGSTVGSGATIRLRLPRGAALVSG